MLDAIHDRPPKLVIEVCVDSVESAVAAIRGGADRLELCANLGHGGGTTPSIGLLQSVKKVAPDVPIMAMVRPRTGDFVYTEGELSVMLQDISVFKACRAQGIVLGVLTVDGDVDENQVRRLVSAALPLDICFHRAFDMTSDPKRGTSGHSNVRPSVGTLIGAWKTLSRITGVTRILTSGHCRYATSEEALKTLAWMLDSATSTSIKILPGSGINISTIPTLCKALLPHGLKEIHLSGGEWIDSRSAYRRDGMEMGEWRIWRTEEEAVRKVRHFLEGVRECPA